MKIVLLESSIGVETSYQYSTSFVINDQVAIDAGSIGFVGTPDQQTEIRNILLTHSHIDHVATLPIHIENAFRRHLPPVRVHGSAAVLEAVQTHLFNDVIWPDFVKLINDGLPFVELVEVHAGQPVTINDLTFTPHPIPHVVPTFAYIVSDTDGSVAIINDTHRPSVLREALSKVENLKAIFLEATFPNSMPDMANVSEHLTPAEFSRELGELDIDVPTYAVHLKAAFRDQVAAELLQLGNEQIAVAQPGHVYNF